jgi:hypothetical protein
MGARAWKRGGFDARQLAVQVGDRYARATLGKGLGGGKPEAPGRAGDGDHPAVERDHGF